MPVLQRLSLGRPLRVQDQFAEDWTGRYISKGHLDLRPPGLSWYFSTRTSRLWNGTLGEVRVCGRRGKESVAHWLMIHSPQTSDWQVPRLPFVVSITIHWWLEGSWKPLRKWLRIHSILYISLQTLRRQCADTSSVRFSNYFEIPWDGKDVGMLPTLESQMQRVAKSWSHHVRMPISDMPGDEAAEDPWKSVQEECRPQIKYWNLAWGTMFPEKMNQVFARIRIKFSTGSTELVENSVVRLVARVTSYGHRNNSDSSE